MDFELRIEINKSTKADLKWQLGEIYLGLMRCYGKESVIYKECKDKAIVRYDNIMFAIEELNDDEYVLYEYFLEP